jgi:iron complex outermembrane recepter protein
VTPSFLRRTYRWTLLSVLFCMTARAELPPTILPEPTDLTALSLEQLASLQVTSVSKKAQRQTAAAAAVHVITNEEIHRSGVRTIAEALRLAPGVEVGQINSNQWSIGVRGFGSRLARSTLVLIDGRSEACIRLFLRGLIGKFRTCFSKTLSASR